MKMHKIISVIAAAATGLSLLAGCGSVAPAAAAAETETAESTPAAEDMAADAAAQDEAPDIEIDLEEIASQVKYSKTDEEWEIPLSGCILTLPESFKDLKGQVYAYDDGETDVGSGVFHCRLFYAPAADADREALTQAFMNYKAESDPDESSLAAVAQASEKYNERGLMPFFDILVFSREYSLSEAKADAWVSEELVGKEIDLGEHGAYRYCCLTRDYSSMAAPIRDSFTDEYYDEFMGLVGNAEQLTGGITCTEPVPLKQEASDSTVISFKTTDLDGNPVTSTELFSGHKITMINIWATWCGPCVEEMPFLEELNKKLAGKDCQIIGICDDTVDDPAALREAKEILKEKGVTYINLVQTEEIKALLPIPAYPTSYFVDSEGHVVTSPETGANVNAYAPRIEKALKDME